MVTFGTIDVSRQTIEKMFFSQVKSMSIGGANE